MLLLAAMTAVGPVAMNMYLPALPVVQAHFVTSIATMNLTVSLTLLAFAVGILIYGPLSDHFGRRPVIIAGLVVFAAGCTICLLAPSFSVLLAGRIVQALGSSAGLVVARAMLGDIYGREQMARMLALLTMIMVIGPTVAPLVGGITTETLGWRWLFLLLLAGALVSLMLAWRLLPETRPAEARLGGGMDLIDASLSLLRRPAFLCFTAQAAVTYAVFFTFISSAPYVMASLGHPASVYGVWYLVLSGGYMLGNWLVSRYAARTGLERLISAGLLLQFLSAGVGAGLALAGIWHPAAIFVPIALVSLGQGLALPNLIASAVALSPRAPGAASSLLGFAQQVVGASCVQAVAYCVGNTPRPLYLFVLGLSLLAFLSQPLVARWVRANGA